ncbi:MAG: DUF362 domain-containing protein [Eubacteriales bacterium]|nr:DUF362 domain-containing protein [Clostridiales bacterium]MDY5016225.1 DUF362 domain-containing protein [Eubacteriales bacterium]
MEKSKVYFTKTISPDAVLALYRALGRPLSGKVAVKVHSGEVGNQNFLHPDFWKPMIDEVHGTIVECNTAYEGRRDTTEKHLDTMEKHGWNAFPVDILDAEGELALPVRGGFHLTENYVGAHMTNYDSLLVLSHFKGHPMGGFGGALKNISIGLASAHGKAVIHGAGDAAKLWSAEQKSFLESMADADESILRYWGERIAFVNVMANMSVDCDCCAVAEDPKIADIGVLSSLDPVALDAACVDLVYASDDPGKADLIERIESRKGLVTLEAAESLGLGSRQYTLIEL